MVFEDHHLSTLYMTLFVNKGEMLFPLFNMKFILYIHVDVPYPCLSYPISFSLSDNHGLFDYGIALYYHMSMLVSSTACLYWHLFSHFMVPLIPENGLPTELERVFC